MPTNSKEDFLKAVLLSSGSSEEVVSASVLAKKLEVSNAAITDMAKKLQSMGLVTHEKYKGLELTGDGKKIALNILRRHRLWELFLQNVLGLEWSKVHIEAENLEHQTSDYLIDKIDEYLGYPEFDPHGDPIPQKNGEMPVVPDSFPLLYSQIGMKYLIVKVGSQDHELIDHLTKLGLLLNTKIEVVNKLNFDHSVVITKNGTEYSLSGKIAENIFVIETND